ncbi:RHS repeat-associated core domain-containing protein [Kribbella sindirgiensis]|uniref:RHS repeat-associated core domain-containing protein n=1 Tax=Kribbella sindirgiensis TaxID=1124744 RepID=UPI0013F3D61B|nr:RHS repeat-associated core domain-containing protein [Kribbella sindirgiensis]
MLTATTANYEPYGLTRAGPSNQTPSSPPTPGYIGGLKLPTGNYLLGQREYNPTTGTFLTTDQAGSANPYAYTAANPLKSTDLQGLDGIDGTLTDVSHISGYISTAALGGAVICTLARACGPAVPILLQVSSATGVLSAGTAGILDSQACILKGNCSQLVADVGVGLIATRFPGLGQMRAAAGNSTGELIRVADFANDRAAFSHYAKHVKGIKLGSKGSATLKNGGPDVPEVLDYQTYRRRARLFMGGGAQPGTIEGVRSSDGAVIRLDPSTGYFGVRSRDGIIRTFFRPDDPTTYFLEQLSP